MHLSLDINWFPLQLPSISTRSVDLELACMRRRGRCVHTYISEKRVFYIDLMWLSLSWYGGETRSECKLPAETLVLFDFFLLAKTVHTGSKLETVKVS
jgi:hypothetical protein